MPQSCYITCCGQRGMPLRGMSLRGHAVPMLTCLVLSGMIAGTYDALFSRIKRHVRFLTRRIERIDIPKFIFKGHDKMTRSRSMHSDAWNRHYVCLNPENRKPSGALSCLTKHRSWVSGHKSHVACLTRMYFEWERYASRACTSYSVAAHWPGYAPWEGWWHHRSSMSRRPFPHLLADGRLGS